jgi:hypothetical protein
MTIDAMIGRNVHHMMWDKHIQHRAVYEAMGVTRFTLAKKLRGDVTWSANDVVVAARVLGVTPCELYEEVSPQVTHDYRAQVIPFPRRLVPVVEREHLAPVSHLDDYRRRAAA